MTGSIGWTQPDFHILYSATPGPICDSRRRPRSQAILGLKILGQVSHCNTFNIRRGRLRCDVMRLRRTRWEAVWSRAVVRGQRACRRFCESPAS